MDYLWTPWRYRYVINNISQPGEQAECVFCAAAAGGDDREAMIVHRAKWNFIIVNRFPYTSGHVMVVPYEHAPSLESFSDDTLTETILLARRCERKLRAIYSPDGLNVGINLGKSAGAGVADHLHVHVLPRWTGDTSFMTVVAETRILPEETAITWERLHEAFLTP